MWKRRLIRWQVPKQHISHPVEINLKWTGTQNEPCTVKKWHWEIEKNLKEAPGHVTRSLPVRKIKTAGTVLFPTTRGETSFSTFLRPPALQRLVVFFFQLRKRKSPKSDRHESRPTYQTTTRRYKREETGKSKKTHPRLPKKVVP